MDWLCRRGWQFSVTVSPAVCLCGHMQGKLALPDSLHPTTTENGWPLGEHHGVAILWEGPVLTLYENSQGAESED